MTSALCAASIRYAQSRSFRLIPNFCFLQLTFPQGAASIELNLSCCDAAPLHLEDLKIGMTGHPHPTSTHVAVFCPLRLTPSRLLVPPLPLPFSSAATVATSLSPFTPRGGAPCLPCISAPLLPPRCAAISVPLKPARRQRRMRRRAESRQS